MYFLIGSILALVVGVFAAGVGFDRERAFYPTVLIVIASTYLLFASMAGGGAVLAAEVVVFAGFAVAAVIGFRFNMWFVVAALIGHGVMDMFHGHVIDNPGVPEWWPTFCMSYDVVAGGLLALILLGRGDAAAPRPRAAEAIKPHIDAELRAATEPDADAAESFRHLERAHVLSQVSTVQHVRVHLRMLAWAHRRGRCEEMGAQISRIIGAAILTPFGAVPRGNTGGSNVAGFQRLPIPADLSAIIATAEARA